MHSDFWLERDLSPWNEGDFSPEHLHADLADQPGAAQFLDELRAYLHAAPSGHVRGMKETLLFEKLGWLRAFAPDLRIILLVRDPRAVVASIVGRGMGGMWGYGEKIAPRIARSTTLATRTRQDAVVQAVWSWKERLALGLGQAVLFDHHVLRLEDLVDRPTTALGGLMGFLGLSMDQGQLDFIAESREEQAATTYSWSRTRSSVLNGWENTLGAHDVEFVERNLVEEMARFGYGRALAEHRAGRRRDAG